MQVIYRLTDGVITALGEFPAGAPDQQHSVYGVADDFAVPAGQVASVINDNISFTPYTPVATPNVPPAPDIQGLVSALLNSSSIDQSTKNALISALEGK